MLANPPTETSTGLTIDPRIAKICVHLTYLRDNLSDQDLELALSTVLDPIEVQVVSKRSGIIYVAAAISEAEAQEIDSMAKLHRVFGKDASGTLCALAAQPEFAKHVSDNKSWNQFRSSILERIKANPYRLDILSSQIGSPLFWRTLESGGLFTTVVGNHLNLTGKDEEIRKHLGDEDLDTLFGSPSNALVLRTLFEETALLDGFLSAHREAFPDASVMDRLAQFAKYVSSGQILRTDSTTNAVDRDLLILAATGKVFWKINLESFQLIKERSPASLNPESFDLHTSLILAMPPEFVTRWLDSGRPIPDKNAPLSPIIFATLRDSLTNSHSPTQRISDLRAKICLALYPLDDSAGLSLESNVLSSDFIELETFAPGFEVYLDGRRKVDGGLGEFLARGRKADNVTAALAERFEQSVLSLLSSEPTPQRYGIPEKVDATFPPERLSNYMVFGTPVFQVGEKLNHKLQILISMAFSEIVPLAPIMPIEDSIGITRYVSLGSEQHFSRHALPLDQSFNLILRYCYQFLTRDPSHSLSGIAGSLEPLKNILPQGYFFDVDHACFKEPSETKIWDTTPIESRPEESAAVIGFFREAFIRLSVAKLQNVESNTEERDLWRGILNQSHRLSLKSLYKTLAVTKPEMTRYAEDVDRIIFG